MDGIDVTCPKCGASFPLSETLAQPLVERERAKYDLRMKTLESAVATKEADVAAREAEIMKRQASIEKSVQEGIGRERKLIAEEEARKAKDELAARTLELEKKLADETAKRKVEAQNAKDELALQMQELAAELTDEKAKRKEAEKRELELSKRSQELQDDKERWDLEKARQLDAERDLIKKDAAKHIDDQHRLKDMEKEKTIADLRTQLEDALRKSEQGSQQLQGEVLELELQGLLTQKFPWDTLEEVKKGQRGGDLIQRVSGMAGVVSGTILWETKRTQNWGGDWISKLKHDAREAKADVAVIVSDILPKGIDSFGDVDGVWVAKQAYALPLAEALRHMLLEVSNARIAAQGKQTKSEMLYDYVTGAEFKSRLQGIVEPFIQMKTDLETEKRMTNRRWAQREKLIERVLLSSSGMVGDLQGIAGKAMPELEAFAEADEPDELDRLLVE